MVVVVLDTARALDTVPAGESGLPTLSRLAETGTEFRRAFATAPWTLPSHAGLLTGTYTSRHGTHGEDPDLDATLTTLPESFSAAGYETRAISNNTWFSDEFGFDRGFDVFENAWSAAEDEPASSPAEDAWEDHEWRTRVTKTCEAGATTDLALDWIAAMEGRPFLLFLNYIDAHFRYAPPREYVADRLPAGYDYDRAVALLDSPEAFNVGEETLTGEELAVLRALYRGELAALDDNLGRIVDALKREGAWEDTVLVVTSDHGENIGEHGLVGHQYNLYETVLHVPLVVTGGAFDGGPSTDRLVQLTDLAPTLLDVAGIDDPSAREQFQGRSVHPSSSALPREFVVGEHVTPRPPIETLEERYGDLPPSLGSLTDSLPLRSIRTDEHKLVLGADGSRERYHVDRDPGETTDLAGEGGDVGDGLAADLKQWLGSFEHRITEGSTAISPEAEERLRDLGYL